MREHTESERKHTLVLSDVHLSQAHPEDPADPKWMRYRRRVHHPDVEFARLIDHLLSDPDLGGDPIEIVFNGDVFDFDTPWVKDGDSSFDEFPPTDEGCSAHARLILEDHVVFFDAVRKALAHGHSVTFLSGNHDLELYWPGVRKVIREALGHDEPRVRFRAWFHVSNDRIYFEHGSQYDIHNAVRNPAVPLTAEGDRLHPVLGKLAFRRTGSRMGYFNPYYEETFYMGLFGYLGHFAKDYLFSHRHIVRTWFFGSLSTALEIWRHRHANERHEEGRAAVRAEVGEVSDEAIDATHALRTPLAEETMVPVLRELWLDRVGLAFFSLLVVAAAFALGPVKGLVALVVVVGLFVLYELTVPKPDIRTYDSAPESVLGLLRIHKVRAICMGHTHRPFVRVLPEGTYANSGSWCPAFHDRECTKPVLDGRPVLWFSTEGDALWGGLHWWRHGELIADPDASSGAPRNEAVKIDVPAGD